MDPAILAGGLGTVFSILVTIVVVGLSILCPLLITGVTLFFVYKMFSGMKAGQQERNALLTTGTPAQARIDQVSMGSMVTTVGVRRSLQMTVVLSVLHEDAAPEVVSLTTMVPEMAMAALQPGTTVPVRLDPADSSKLAIDLPAMGYADAQQYL